MADRAGSYPRLLAKREQHRAEGELDGTIQTVLDVDGSRGTH